MMSNTLTLVVMGTALVLFACQNGALAAKTKVKG